MSLRHAVFGSGIAGFSLFGADLALSGNSALKLRFNFTAASLFQRIRTTRHKERDSERKRDQQALHPLILGTN